MDSEEQKNGGLRAEEAAQEEDGTLPPRGGNPPQQPDAQPSDGQAYGVPREPYGHPYPIHSVPGSVHSPARPYRRRHRGGVFRIRKPVLLGGAAVLVVVSVLLTILFIPRPKKETGPVFLNEAMGVPVRTVLLDAGAPGRPGTKREIKYLVIHETGNPSDGTGAKSHSNFLQSGGSGKTSWHYTVDDHEIYHHIPDDEIAWHASSEDGNTHGIGIELCVNADGDFEETFQNGARLTACLLKAYGLTADDIRQHGDFTEKNCPETIRDTGRWAEFLQRVKAYYAELKKS